MHIIRLAVALGALLFISGCAVVMAAKQPDRKDISLFDIGTNRTSLLAEFGAPTISEEREGRKYEIFKFTQGYSTVAKVSRAAFHGAADVMTLGLWEVVGTPAEIVFSGDEMAYQVRYDDQSRVDEVIPIKRK